ncbi:MAG: SAM-dependent methyltransferase [Proteobacteria bacterium]|nr:SAM-dependent methyltransferase [Pseudomonadota bacterium]
MHIDSRRVSSNQLHTHTNLPSLLQRHLQHRHRKPVAEHSRTAFDVLREALESQPRPLVLDSFCGTGRSTALLAQRHPKHLVVGVDKSAHRLARHVETKDENYLLLQAECEDIWQLLLGAEIPLEYHYLLYPNPWPKSRHIQRRVHGNATFPWLLRLGGIIELRSNWRLYVEEFGLAMHLAGYCGNVFLLPEADPLTLFEEKYRASGHELWAYVGDTSKKLHRDATGVLG